MAKTYLRKRQLAERYGGVTLRSIERAVEAGRIPEPEYPCVALFSLRLEVGHRRLLRA